MATKITDRIWIGSSRDGNHPPPECDAILNCAFDLFNEVGWNQKIHLAHCGLIDGPGNPLAAYRSAVYQLEALAQLDRKILVHCHKGESRSVAVVIGHLHSLDNKGWDYWREFIRDKRETPDHTPHSALRSLFNDMFLIPIQR